LVDTPAVSVDSEADPIVYNPGGLVPEVSEPLPLPFFGAILLGLAFLLLIPGGIKLVRKSTQAKPPKEKLKPRIKLKD
jgi:hypothetical protein